MIFISWPHGIFTWKFIVIWIISVLCIVLILNYWIFFKMPTKCLDIFCLIRFDNKLGRVKIWSQSWTWVSAMVASLYECNLFTFCFILRPVSDSTLISVSLEVSFWISWRYQTESIKRFAGIKCKIASIWYANHSMSEIFGCHKKIYFKRKCLID